MMQNWDSGVWIKSWDFVSFSIRTRIKQQNPLSKGLQVCCGACMWSFRHVARKEGKNWSSERFHYLLQNCKWPQIQRCLHSIGLYSRHSLYFPHWATKSRTRLHFCFYKFSRAWESTGKYLERIRWFIGLSWRSFLSTSPGLGDLFSHRRQRNYFRARRRSGSYLFSCSVRTPGVGEWWVLGCGSDYATNVPGLPYWTPMGLSFLTEKGWIRTRWKDSTLMTALWRCFGVLGWWWEGSEVLRWWGDSSSTDTAAEICCIADFFHSQSFFEQEAPWVKHMLCQFWEMLQLGGQDPFQLSVVFKEQTFQDTSQLRGNLNL